MRKSKVLTNKLSIVFSFIFILLFLSCSAPKPQYISLPITKKQEDLPDIVKRVVQSTAVVVVYDSDGEELGQGSGFFIDRDGSLITNFHVMENATQAIVYTNDGNFYPISHVLAEDLDGDLILVSVDVPQKAVVPLTLSHTIPELGESVVVIGSPQGLYQTVSDGIVSAVRDIPEFGKIIQMTAPISYGSSGSPVLNMKGDVIGVASFQMIEGQNLNFAIPSERITNLKIEERITLEDWQINRFVEEVFIIAEQYYSDGMTYYWLDDYESAIPFFQSAVISNPFFSKAYFCLGYCNSKIGKYADAIEYYKSAIYLEYEPDISYYNMGIAYGELGEYEKAIESYKEAIRLNPNDASAYNNMGIAYDDLGEYEKAIESYKEAIRLNPNDASAYYNMGNSFVNLGQYEKAIEYYTEAIRINPDYAVAYSNMGAAYGELSQYAKAIEYYTEAIRINPDYAVAYSNMGAAYGGLGEDKKAIESYNEAIRINPEYAKAHFGLGLTYHFMGNRGSAMEEYKILKGLDKDLANELFNLIFD